ncbi:MAG: epimerase [Planctomycetaceae bacterium]
MIEDSKPTGRIVIAGGTGFLGMNLDRHLAESDCEVILISRHAPADEGRRTHAVWDGRTLGDWVEHLDGAAALVNLAGRSVDCIKTPDRCDEILRSRVEATEVLGRALRTVENPPPVWVQMSTAHIYGDPPVAICDEDSAYGYGLAPFVARAWEDAFAKSVLRGMRPVILRTSFVLGRNGGALQTLGKLARRGLGGTVGNGKQGISWIHERDMNRLFARGIADESMRGTYVATAPNPVSNREFMRALRRAIRMPVGLPAAGWMVRLGAPLFLRTDPELALYGRYCVSRRLREEGFEFAFPEVAKALRDVFGTGHE